MKLLMKARVGSVREEASGIRSYRLLPEKRAEFPAFTPGAHVTVHLPSGLRRQYSLCSDSRDRSHYRICVQREASGRGGSAEMHDRVAENEALFVSFPDNRFPLAEDARRHVLIAGGIGITPFVPMVLELSRARTRFALHYCARGPERAAFVPELERLCPDGALFLHYDGGVPARGLDVAALLAEPEEGAHVYCCGPAPLVEAVRRATTRWEPRAVHFEDFRAPPTRAQAAGKAFRIRIASTDRVLNVPENRTALQVLRDAGYDIDSSCEAGACGTCSVRYTAGEPIHADFALPPGDRGWRFVTCVSRAEGELTLDLQAAGRGHPSAIPRPRA